MVNPRMAHMGKSFPPKKSSHMSFSAFLINSRNKYYILLTEHYSVATEITKHKMAAM